ncbi:MAG TPA: SMP-30/gluconolactonase/LRE family protein, partial [Polyangiaceae bacterium]|nr:SMP-30/gluconolactonase/LRE family protein [Polyangiaceae bacterium]
TRLNDGKCDPRGRFWVGSICEHEPEFDGGLYCLDTNLSLSTKLTRIQCSNGLVWTRDNRTFYFIDTPTQEIWGFHFDPESGAIREKRVVARIPSELGSPDGMSIDADDHLWVALFGGHRVIRVDPASGRIELQIPVPASNVTSVAFGGRDLDELYITTARIGLTPEQCAAEPLAGSLFCVQVPYQGVVANRFGRNLGTLSP